jgi:Protein of unknown function (DUF1688)
MLSSMTATQGVAYLRTLPSIRERCTRVHELAKQGLLDHFDYAPHNEVQVVKYCIEIIQVNPSQLTLIIPSNDILYISVISVLISNL